MHKQNWIDEVRMLNSGKSAQLSLRFPGLRNPVNIAVKPEVAYFFQGPNPFPDWPILHSEQRMLGRVYGLWLKDGLIGTLNIQIDTLKQMFGQSPPAHLIKWVAETHIELCWMMIKLHRAVRRALARQKLLN